MTDSATPICPPCQRHQHHVCEAHLKALGYFHFRPPNPGPCHCGCHDPIDNQWLTEAALSDMDEHETLAFYTKVLQSRLGRYEQRTYLYYYFDIDRLLLYVGVTDDLETRTKAHEKSSAWMRFVSYRRVAVLFSREYAEWVERKEIQEKNPLFNVAHSNPGYEQRLVDYLVSKNALNLLAPIRKTARDSPELA